MVVGLVIPKTKNIRSKKHIQRLKSLACMICSFSPVDAHHLLRAGGKGMGQKAGDNWAVPLCRLHHLELHQLGGEVEFFERRGMPYEGVKRYATELWEQTHEG